MGLWRKEVIDFTDFERRQDTVAAAIFLDLFADLTLRVVDHLAVSFGSLD
jgi:hypothetical protein